MQQRQLTPLPSLRPLPPPPPHIHDVWNAQKRAYCVFLFEFFFPLSYLRMSVPSAAVIEDISNS